MSREGRSQPIQPVVQHGFLGNTPANGTLPGQIIVSENDDRRRRTPPLQPVIVNGLYATVVVASVTAPPPAVVVENDRRRLPLTPSIVLSGVLAPPTPATVMPPPVSIVEVDDRRKRVLAAFPEIRRGYDDAAPPLPEVVEQPPRRTFVLQPVVVSGVLGFTVVTVTLPPKPVISFTSEKRQAVVSPVLPTPWLKIPVTPPVTATVRTLPLLGVG